MARIVVAEDDELQGELLRRYLEREGHEVEVVADGVRALESVKDGRASLLVLDVMLPGLDGLQVSTRLREEGSELPILMVTARVAENDLLLGLDHGADDYLTKPYSPRELLARVRALLRRSAPRRVDGVLRAGAIALDPARRETRSSGRLVDLTRAEFDLLRALMSAAGSVLSRGQLLVALHGDGRFITERTIDAHVKNLRAKLELDPEAPGGIETVYGVGYRFSSTGETGPRAS
ncbi:response regulator transcription factor [Curtobacterium sp. APC 4022]|uniref:response regulator transcription factor n=1 Tax=Curtobacterium sp. APC 4022 TaxID=3035201 RepID=UPI0025B5261D|nr:response regulator transcription factor [Curtobacterium sp. APC 4022]MDN3477728.1 response regulator transcription factor [Curtobacterium sp. APC 4022]